MARWRGLQGLALVLILMLGCGEQADDIGGVAAGTSTGTSSSGSGGAATGGADGAGGTGGHGAGGGQGGAAPALAFPGAEWDESTPEAQGLDGDALDAAMSYYASVSGTQGTDQALVIRNGLLIWQGSDIDNVHNTWSVTKSFASTVLGLLVDDGLCAPATLASDHLALLAGSYGAVTLEHFATMTSGYDGGGDQSDQPFTPTAALFSPGTAFQYWDSAMNQFGNVLTRIAGEPIETLFTQRIADPIQMASDDWDWGDWGPLDGIEVNGAAGNKSRGIHTSARQLARFGHLMLARGTWNGTPLVSGSWVSLATTTQVPSNLPAHTAGSTGPGVYGYNWWVNGIGPDQARRWPDAPPETFAASGHNHNRMYVVPPWRMVIVRLGTDGDPPDDDETSAFFALLAQALTD